MKQIKTGILLLFCSIAATAQEHPLTLRDAIQRSWAVNKTLQVEKTGIEIAENKLQTIKDARLPEASVSGQYMYLPFAPTVNLKFQQQAAGSSGETGSATGGFPTPHSLYLGQLNVSYPLFTGFKLKNNLKQAGLGIEQSQLSGEMQKEIVALQTINLYLGIYKTNQALKVLDENLVRVNNRIKDFKNFVANGILTENELLSAELQQSNLEISIEEAKSNLANLQYRLNTLLQQDVNNPIVIDAAPIETSRLPIPSDISQRKDIELMNKRAEITKVGIDLAKGNYYPVIALTGGYIGANIPSILSIGNAVNLGVAVKYNISSLYKNKTEVKAAELSLRQSQERISEAEDKARIELNEATHNYELSLKKQKVYQIALTQATENLRIVSNKNKNGLLDTDKLLEADVQLLQAQINEKTGSIDSQLAYYQLLYTSGQLLSFFK